MRGLKYVNKSVVGHRMNIHLKDGSVIPNVLIMGLETKGRRLYYKVSREEVSHVPVSEVKWLKPVIRVFSSY